MQQFQEQVFYHYILQDQSLRKVTQSKFFSNKYIQQLFDVAKEHSDKYQNPPTKEQISEIVRIKGYDQDISEDIINSLYNAKNLLEEYDKDWLDENVKPWIQVRNLETVMRKSIAYMKTTKVTPENASEIVEKIRHMMTTETALDFGFNLGSDFFDPENHKQSRLQRSSTGYEFLDLCLKGGWWKGSLIAFLASPKSGKCCVGDTYVNIRNKKTGEIKKMKYKDLYDINKRK